MSLALQRVRSIFALRGATRENADAARDAGRWSEAAKLYASVLRFEPGNADLWVQCGHARKEGGDITGAVEAYGRACKLAPFDIDARLHFVNALHRNDENERAAAEAMILIEQLIECENLPDNLRAAASACVVAEADRLRDSRAWAKAAVAYRAALSIKPQQPKIWVQLGHAEKESGDTRAAEAAYREAVQQDSSDSDAWTQLGHALKLNGRRLEAMDSYARALILDKGAADAQSALANVAGYDSREIERAFDRQTARQATRFDTYGRLSSDLSGAEVLLQSVREKIQTHRRLLAKITRRRSDVRVADDVIYLSGIDWRYRRQRPQHIAAALADTGRRVIYVSNVFEPADSPETFRIASEPYPGVFEVRLRIAAATQCHLHQEIDDFCAEELRTALYDLWCSLGLLSPVLLIDNPCWSKVVSGFGLGAIVYDCIDDLAAFPDAPAALLQEEARLIEAADLVVATSRVLTNKIENVRPAVLVPNGVETRHFTRVAEMPSASERPVIGYFGILGAWFQADWIRASAVNHPEWDFHLIGEVSEADISKFYNLPNVKLFGERPYQELPYLLAQFYVATIPFKVNELTRAVNPVKIYEYLAGGRPVVATRMPELEGLPGVTLCTTASEFDQALVRSIFEDTAEKRRARSLSMQAHDWSARVEALLGAIKPLFPQVVAAVAPSQGRSTELALKALSDYPYLRVIEISSAAFEERLLEVSQAIGLDAQTEIVVMVGNSAPLTWGWVRNLITPLLRDKRVEAVVIDDDWTATKSAGSSLQVASRRRMDFRELLPQNTVAIWRTSLEKGLRALGAKSGAYQEGDLRSALTAEIYQLRSTRSEGFDWVSAIYLQAEKQP
ncbi:MAG: hypothetical protein B7Z68_03165 [Acidobacteria bacterium 21-70-11]|nr:MAG: hypothetical protein B7Z68_03165 [Acidobacteria bacterium 21-70-11]